MAIIIPAILEETLASFQDKLFKATHIPGVDRIQVDFGDGKFVSHQTLPITEIAPLSPAFVWEAHLMVQEPVDFLDYQLAGFNTLIVHIESFTDASAIIPALQAIAGLGMRAGIALNPDTQLEQLSGVSGFVKHITLLSVDPGFQGGSFQTRVLERIPQVKKLLPGVILEVDGGIKPDQVPDLVAAGADQLVVGSGIFGDIDPAAAFNRYQQKLI